MLFPAKLVFSEKKYRTSKLNELVELLCITDKGLGQKKGGKKTDFSVSSLRVGTTDEISKQLLEDIEVLANLEPYLNI